MKLPLLIATGIGALLCLAGCTPDRLGDTEDETRAWVPVYMQMSEMDDVSISNARTTEKS